jgi:hypothetical protein
MRLYMRIPKSFTIERDVSEFVDRTKGNGSASDRINELLRQAILQERYARLEAEAADFFADAKQEHTETRAFQKAALRTLRRD